MSIEPAALSPTATRDRLHLPALERWNLDSVQTAMLGGVLLLTALVYLRCLANDFVSDDVVMILHNRFIAHWSYLWVSLTKDLWWFNESKGATSGTSFYQPIQSVWLGLAYHLFGPNPLGWHLAKIALHLTVVVLVFRAAQLLSHDTGVALLAALLFALLPVHAEPVVWATDIPEPLSSAFDLGALCLFIQRRKGRYWRGLVTPLILYAAAAFTHESAVVFPFLIGAYVFMFEVKRDEASAESSETASVTGRLLNALKWCAPFFLIAFLYLSARAVVLGTGGILGFAATKNTAALVQSKVAIRSLVIHHSGIDIFLTLPTVLLWYLSLLLFPWLPGPAHDVPFVTHPTLAGFCAPASGIVILVVVGYLLLLNSPHARLYLFCALWWLVTTSPAPLPGIRIGADLVYDRYQYLPSFAFCLVLADLAVRFARKGVRQRRLIASAFVALTAIYAVALWHVEPVWHDNVTMFSRSVVEVPNSAHYHQVLGGVLAQNGDLEHAERELVYASKLAPEDYTIHYELGALYMRMKRGDDASRELAAFYRTVFAQKSSAQNIVLPPIIIGPNSTSSTQKTPGTASH